MDTFLENMLAKAADQGMSQADIARRLHVTPATLSNWKIRGVPSRAKVPLMRLVGVSIAGLAEHLVPQAEIEATTTKAQDIVHHALSPTKVPLISWIQAGAWCSASDPFEPGDAERWLESPVRHGENTYALRVRGDSMTAPYGRSYPEGCIIFVDPGKCPVHGSRIIAKLKGSDEVTFKVLKKEDGRTWLAPLNPQHPPIHDEFRILGTVIGTWHDE